jgi:hypothetical protein
LNIVKEVIYICGLTMWELFFLTGHLHLRAALNYGQEVHMSVKKCNPTQRLFEAMGGMANKMVKHFIFLKYLQLEFIEGFRFPEKLDL